MYGFGEGPPGISSEENMYWERMWETRHVYTFWVVMFDKFLSGWGPARSRKALFVYGCLTAGDAKTVADNARRRGDQTSIRILSHVPHINPKTTRLEFVEREGPHSNWYKPNFFKEHE